MVSVITDRVGGVLPGVPITVGFGISTAVSVTGLNNYVAAGSPGIAALAANQYIVISPPATNTGPVTLDLDSSGAKPVQSPSGNALAAGEFAANVSYFMRYTGTAWVIISSGAVF